MRISFTWEEWHGRAIFYLFFLFVCICGVHVSCDRKNNWKKMYSWFYIVDSVTPLTVSVLDIAHIRIHMNAQSIVFRMHNTPVSFYALQFSRHIPKCEWAMEWSFQYPSKPKMVDNQQSYTIYPYSHFSATAESNIFVMHVVLSNLLATTNWKLNWHLTQSCAQHTQRFAALVMPAARVTQVKHNNQNKYAPEHAG